MPSAFDPIWLGAAARIGIPVERGGEAYVHFDGAALHIASDEHLDADDTVAQLVLHEICHALVQGPELMRTPDWGLDNTRDDDAVNEAAAVRLQAHLLGGYGLREVLFPTTVVRDFYFALPSDALIPVEDASARLARVAALRSAQEPFAKALHDALADTSRVLQRPLHPRSGHPLLDGKSCGDCSWRTAGGMCRQAPRRAFVGEEDGACSRWEGALDCLACGACCRSAYDSVTISRRDPVVRRHPELVVHHDSYDEIRREGDRCAALHGPGGGPFSCVIYGDRPRPCRDFERGGRHCLDARRRVGLSS